MNNSKMNMIPIILSFIVIAFAILYLTKYQEWQNTPITYSGATEINEITDIDDRPNGYDKIEDGIAKNVLSKYDFNKIQNYYGGSFKDIYYSKKSISSEYMIYLAVFQLFQDDFSKECKVEKTISAYDMKAKVAELFGSKPYTDSSFELDGLKVTFENNQYKIATNKCSALDLMSDRIDTEYVSNKVENDKLIITTYAYLVTFDNGVYSYYKDVTRNSEVLGHDIATIDRGKIAKYNIIFGKNIDNTYYLEGFEKA